MSVTRAYIRRRILRLSRQGMVVTATSSGTTTTLVDAVNLGTPGATLVNRIGWVSAGTTANLGATVRVTTNDRSATSITFTPALSSATAVGDEIELWNELGQGVEPSYVHELLDFAIERVADANPVPALGAEFTFDVQAPVIDLPPSWRWVEGADWQDASGLWHPVPENDKNLRVDPVSRTVELLGIAAGNADTLLVRLRGATRPAALASDGEDTIVNAEYLVQQVTAEVLLAASYTASSMDGPALERRAAYHAKKADELRQVAFTPHTGMGVILPL